MSSPLLAHSSEPGSSHLLMNPDSLPTGFGSIKSEGTSPSIPRSTDRTALRMGTGCFLAPSRQKRDTESLAPLRRATTQSSAGSWICAVRSALGHRMRTQIGRRSNRSHRTTRCFPETHCGISPAKC